MALTAKIRNARSLIGLAVILLALNWIFAPFAFVPPLARDLPANIEEATKLFETRVTKQFPLGTEAQSVRDVLVQEGFKVGENTASFSKKKFVCEERWIITWQSADKKITSLNAVYGLICP